MPPHPAPAQSETTTIPFETSPAPGIFPATDLVNSLSHPTGQGYHFTVSEGTYTLRDDILLGLIPHHPTAAPAQPINVLDPKPRLPTAGVQASLVVLGPRSRPSQFRRVRKSGSIKSLVPPSIEEAPTESSHSVNSGSEHGALPAISRANQSPSKLGFGSLRGRFGDSRSPSHTKSKEAKEALKRAKPKQNLGKTGSTFVSKVVHDEHLSKRLNEHSSDGIYAFVNINRAFLWMDLSSHRKHDNLTKILFTKFHPLCHDFNAATKTSTHVDVAIGFGPGDVFWYEPMSQKYSRINKNGMIHGFAVSVIKWVPKSEKIFVAAHYDGTLVIYDKEREDAAFEPEDDFRLPTKFTKTGRPVPRLVIRKSIHSQNQAANPVGLWKVSPSRIRGMEFSPDGRLLAIVSEDGSLRIIDYAKEQLLDVMSSYYGGMTCVCWSADGMYLLTGSQDDLVSIWSLADRMLVARCVGHHSWLTGVAFDPWHCDDRTYRFGSVGEDGRLLLWDFSVGLLNKPKAISVRQSISSYAPAQPLDRSDSIATMKTAIRDGESNSETPVGNPKADVDGLVQSATAALHLEQQKQQQAYVQGQGQDQDQDQDQVAATPPTKRSMDLHGDDKKEEEEEEEEEDEDDDDDDNEIYHPAVLRSHVPMLPPVLTRIIDPHPLTGLAFEEDCIITTCRRGHIRMWARPKGDVESRNSTGQASGAHFRFTDPFRGS